MYSPLYVGMQNTNTVIIYLKCNYFIFISKVYSSLYMDTQNTNAVIYLKCNYFIIYYLKLFIYVTLVTAVHFFNSSQKFVRSITTKISKF